MTRKILVIMLLAAVAAVGSQAFSSSAAQQGEKEGSTPPKVSEKPTGPKNGADAAAPAVGTGQPAGDKSVGTAHPTAPSFRPSPLFPTAPASSKSESAGKIDASKKGGSAANIPVSSATIENKGGKRQLVVEQAMVTLKFDNRVPAAEPGMVDVPVDEGQSVEKDDIVAYIDSRSVEARRRIAEAEMAAAQAQAENDAEIEVAEKAVEVTKAEYDQSVDIRAKNPAAVPLTQLRKDKFNWEKSIAQVKQAKNEKHIAGLTFNAKKAQYEAASIELDLRQARAPFKGQVVEVLKKTGDWVTAGEPIMHIVGLDDVRVTAMVYMNGPEGASPDEIVGRDVTITVFAAGDKKHTVKGKIGFASPVIEGLGTSRTFDIWADVANEKSIDPVTGQEVWKIQPGSRATMTIDLSSRPVASRVQAYRPVSTEVKEESGKKTAPVER